MSTVPVVLALTQNCQKGERENQCVCVCVRERERERERESEREKERERERLCVVILQEIVLCMRVWILVSISV